MSPSPETQAHTARASLRCSSGRPVGAVRTHPLQTGHRLAVRGWSSGQREIAYCQDTWRPCRRESEPDQNMLCSGENWFSFVGRAIFVAPTALCLCSLNIRENQPRTTVSGRAWLRARKT